MSTTEHPPASLARPAKDFESWETVSIAESAQCSLVQCLAQLLPREQTSLYARIDDLIRYESGTRKNL